MRHVFFGGSSQPRNPMAAMCRLVLINTTLISLVGSSASIMSLPARAASNVKKAATSDADRANGSGTLLAMSSLGQPVGQCPLKHTSVSTKISGYVARVTVKQTFTNPYKDKIEAIYTFPLGESGAVDDMTMKVGSRLIHGTIKKREEARQIYNDARARGNVASLLDQERTNIFTQSVANIEPGASIEITLQYVELLKYDAGRFSFSFPTVVGPRFIPGNAIGKEGTGRAPDTDSVPDASRITPPVAPENTRAGHDISIDVDVDAGVPIHNVSSKLHEVTVNNVGPDEAKISLKDKATIPNKDFVLSWDVAGDALKSGYLTHKDAKAESGYFTLMLLPPKQVTTEKIAPKEMIFLIDCSGSQRGKPLDKAKETLSYIVEHMNPQDTFQIIAFSNEQKLLFEKPQAVTSALKARAAKFIDELQANGGTWMAPAVEKACAIPADDHRLRIVTFMTDGFVGNDLEILGMIHKHRNTSRWFSFGTGNSVNRTLIDGIAKEGGGEADYVLLNSSGAEVGKKFYDHIAAPVLTDVSIDFGKLAVKEVFPKEVGDVWAQRPLYFKGRYIKPGAGTVTLKGFAAGKPYTQTLAVKFPESNSKNEVLGSIWARAKVDRLMAEDYIGAQSGQINKELKDEIVKTALDHHIMTNYTSFVAVEEKVVTKGGVSRTVTVPVEMPDGVSREATLGDGLAKARPMAGHFNFARNASKSLSYGYGSAGGMAPPSPAMTLSAQAPSAPGVQHYAHYAPQKSTVPMQTPTGAPTATLSILSYAKNPQQSANNRPLEVTDARKQEDALKEENEKSQTATKLDAQLTSLLLAYNANKDLPSMKGINANAKTIEVTVELSDTSAATLKKLKNAGFKLIKKSHNTVHGKIEIEKLKALTQFSFVTLIKSIS